MKVDQRCQAQTTSRLFGEDVGDIVEVVTYNAKNIYVLFSRGGREHCYRKKAATVEQNGRLSASYNFFSFLFIKP